MHLTYVSDTLLPVKDLQLKKKNLLQFEKHCRGPYLSVCYQFLVYPVVENGGKIIRKPRDDKDTQPRGRNCTGGGWNHCHNAAAALGLC